MNVPREEKDKMDEQIVMPKLMSKEDWRQFLNAMIVCAHAGDKPVMDALCNSVREAAAFGGGDVLVYLQTSLLVDAAIKWEDD
jgi:hypothetical protein